MSKVGILKEFWDFLRVRKKFWLLPIILMLLVLGAMVILTQNPVVAPFIYTMF